MATVTDPKVYREMNEVEAYTVAPEVEALAATVASVKAQWDGLGRAGGRTSECASIYLRQVVAALRDVEAVARQLADYAEAAINADD